MRTDDRDAYARSKLMQTAEERPDYVPGTARRARSADELLHELGVHQIELETQNESLRDALLALEEARDRYVDLFEFAPVGYLTLSPVGTIAEINLTGTSLLGQTRKALLDRRLTDFVMPEDRDGWERFFFCLIRRSHRQEHELRLARGGGGSFYARLNGVGVKLADGRIGVRLTLTDISEHKQLEAVYERELRLRLAMQAIAGGLYDWDRRTDCLYWSTELAQVCGVSVDHVKLERRWWRQRVHPDDLCRIRKVVVDALRARNAHLRVEYRMLGRDGEWMYVSDDAHIVHNGAGRVVRIIGTITDITARKTAELALVRMNQDLEATVAERTAVAEARAQALVESERFARATIDALSSRLCVLDEHGRIIATNTAWRDFEALFCTSERIRRETAEGGPSAPWLMPFWSPQTREEVARGLHELLAGRREWFAFEYEFVSDEGSRWFEMRAVRFPDGDPVRLVITHDEISERKLAAEAQRKSALRLKQLGGHLESLREHQSGMIARELHDELGATLTMVKLGLATSRDALSDRGTLNAKIDGLIEHVDTALRVVKRVSSALRPALLDTLGLVATIRSHVAQFSASTGIAASLTLPEYVRLSKVGSTSVFRIIQEGLTNVARHSGASMVTIHARKYRGALIVRLKDNGYGFSPDAVSCPDAFGILGMRQRAEHLGGSLRIGSIPNGGALLTLRIPLDS